MVGINEKVAWRNYKAAKHFSDWLTAWVIERYPMTDVKGYSPLSDEKKELANVCKEIEERMLRYLDTLGRTPGVDGGMLDLARFNVQQGCMWAVRSIFQPTRIALPEDSFPKAE
jgi:hypothetical protein